MLLGTVAGSTESYTITLGTTMFLMVYTWVDSPQKEIGKQIAIDTADIYHPSIVQPIGFKELDKDWVLMKNEKGHDNVGRGLNAINRDKKVRIPIEEFQRLCNPIYEQALKDEIKIKFS